MNFLIFFSIFVATILLSIVLERELNSPILVAIVFLGIYLLIIAALFAFSVITDFPLAILLVIVYAIIAFVSAYLTRFVRCICERYLGSCCTECPDSDNDNLDQAFNQSLGTISNNRHISNIKQHKAELE